MILSALLRRRAPAVLAAVWLAAVSGCGTAPASAPGAATPSSLPDRLTDAEFQRLRTDLREPNGDFHADNFASNEAGVAEIAARLGAGVKGGAYIGVGPEQNFTYIAAVRPSIAFIVDIRRQAAIQHLLFKALFEMSEDRAEFLARLFVRDRAAGLGRYETIRLLWSVFGAEPGSTDARYDRALAEVTSHLTGRRGLALDSVDLSLLDYVYRAFVTLGPSITYGGYDRRLPSGGMNFMTLTLAYDERGTRRSFLATDADYQFVRQMHERNLIVPIEGDLAGPVTIRGIAGYLRSHGAVVSVFYPSNVEQYLFGPVPTMAGSLNQNGGAPAFYENLGVLPTTPASVLVRAQLKRASRELVPMCSIELLVAAAKAGRVRSFEESLRCVR
ncbi:MAG TPA: hypothetical protein VFO19_19760 [Vicinamibacterales bacterium]|nr:hypothetical protein [Vicinamibacterales bacterium]